MTTTETTTRDRVTRLRFIEGATTLGFDVLKRHGFLDHPNRFEGYAVHIDSGPTGTPGLLLCENRMNPKYMPDDQVWWQEPGEGYWRGDYLPPRGIGIVTRHYVESPQTDAGEIGTCRLMV